MHILICGAGLMARAIAFDFLNNSTVSNVTLVDTNKTVLTETERILSSEKISFSRYYCKKP